MCDAESFSSSQPTHLLFIFLCTLPSRIRVIVDGSQVSFLSEFFLIEFHITCRPYWKVLREYISCSPTLQCCMIFWKYLSWLRIFFQNEHLLSKLVSFLVWSETASTLYVGLLYQPRTVDDECGAVGGIRIGRGKRNTRGKPAPVPLCPPQIPHDLNWARVWDAAVEIRRLTAWAMAPPLLSKLLY
jgi:hypothetical protein